MVSPVFWIFQEIGKDVDLQDEVESIEIQKDSTGQGNEADPVSDTEQIVVKLLHQQAGAPECDGAFLQRRMERSSELKL